MSRAKINVEAARMRQRINSMIQNNNNLQYDVRDLRRERNDRAGYQVRSIAGTATGAIFGVLSSGDDCDNCVGE